MVTAYATDTLRYQRRMHREARTDALLTLTVVPMIDVALWARDRFTTPKPIRKVQNHA